MYLSAFLAVQVSAVRTPDMELSKTPSVVTFQELSGMASFFWEMNEKKSMLGDVDDVFGQELLKADATKS